MISLISVGAPILEDACIADVFAVTVNFLFFRFYLSIFIQDEIFRLKHFRFKQNGLFTRDIGL
jgi:hypothetical protein